MTPQQQLRHLRQANAVAIAALQAGHHPFGALLVAPDGDTVLQQQGNVDSVNHAEAVLAREAARLHGSALLWDCTLVTTVEPCAMCAGTIYWAGIRAVVYGLSSEELAVIAGPDFLVPCRELFARAIDTVVVKGPLLLDDARAVHEGFWTRKL